MVAYSCIVLAVLGVFVSQSSASCVPCAPKVTYNAPLQYSLPVPSSIPVGTYCSCQKVSIKPTLSAPVTCCNDGLQSGSLYGAGSSGGAWTSLLSNILQSNPGMLRAAPQATSVPFGGCNGGQGLSQFLPALLAAAPAPASGGCGFAPAPAPVSGGGGGCGFAPAPVRSSCGCGCN